MSHVKRCLESFLLSIGASRLAILGSAVVMTSALATVYASSIEMARSAISAGGARSTGGTFELYSSIGQAAAGTSTSESFILTSGLWLSLSPGDCDGDGTVGIADHESLTDCLAGPATPLSAAPCRCFDLYISSSIDLRDFALYAAAFTGS